MTSVAEWCEMAMGARKVWGYKNAGNDRALLARHVGADSLGRDEIGRVREGEVRAWIGRMRLKTRGGAVATATDDRTRLSIVHVRRVLTLLSHVMRAAIEAGERETDPTIGAADLLSGERGPVTLDARRARALEAHEESELLRVLSHEDGRIDAMVRLALGAGLRQREIVTLRWEDVRIAGEAPQILLQPIKTARAPRQVPLFGMALGALVYMSRDAKTDGRVWSNARGARYSTAPVTALIRAAFAAGIGRPVRWHDLRHTCATALLDGRRGRAWSVTEVQALLGHASVRTTERYAKPSQFLLFRAASETPAVQR